MGGWFGRKSAPADARPFVPVWLRNDSAEEGFARSVDGLRVLVRSSASVAIYLDGAWELSGGPIESPSGGSTVDTQARSAIDQILGALRQHGLITP